MKMAREVLLRILNTAKPALASKNPLMELTHYWFDGEQVSAYDDVIGIQCALKTDFRGGVPGDLLLGVLEKSLSKEVSLDLAEDGKNLSVRAGSFRLDLAVLPIEDRVWTPEPQDWQHAAKLSAEFVEALDLVMISVGDEKSGNPEQRGVTLIPQSGAVDLYSTDARSLSWVRVAVEEALWSSFDLDRCIFPTPFCEQLIKIFDRERTLLVAGENAVHVQTYVGVDKETGAQHQTLLFARLVDDPAPVDFAGVVDKHLTSTHFVPIPARLELALDRALVVLSRVGQNVPAQFSVENHGIFLEAETQLGRIEDGVSLEGEAVHPDISVKADPGLIRRALAGRRGLTFSAQSVVLRGPDNFYHIIATN